MSPMQIWSNESQERYVLAIRPESLESFSEICQRERCPFAVVGVAAADEQLVVNDPVFDNRPVDMSLSVLLGKPPKMIREAAHIQKPLLPSCTRMDVFGTYLPPSQYTEFGNTNLCLLYSALRAEIPAKSSSAPIPE